MDQLSSCYFCGGALEVSLSAYPIIPKSLDPEAEEQGTVVLCSACREKLALIVEPVVKATKADARETVTGAGTAEPSARSDGTRSVENPTTTESVIGPADNGSLLGDDSASTAERDRPEQSVETAEPTAGAETAETAAADTTDERVAAPTEATDTEAAPTEGDNGNADSNEPSVDSHSLTKLEYNKVMRLLQNRAMPVDRTEIREVAVNAYDIDGEQFDAIIDAAVDRGLIGRESGQLVESDE